MKTNRFYSALAGVLLATGSIYSQTPCGFPDPLSSSGNALKCNTGNNGSGLTLPVGTADNFWEVSRNGISGTYVPAVVCGHNVWPGSTWIPSWSTSANWITYPHMSDPNACPSSTNEAKHTCLGAVDEFYRLKICLPDSACGQPIASKFCMKMTFKADNCVWKIYVNSTTSSQYNSSSTNPYYELDYSTSGGTTANLCNGWQPGINTVIVHVKSEIDFTGFLAVIDTSAVRKICDSIPDEPPHGCCLGNECGHNQNKLMADYEIPLNNFDFNFSGDGIDKVNVGYNCGANGIGKLNALTSVRTNADGSSGPHSVAVFGNNRYGKNDHTSVGVMGLISGNDVGKTGIGVFGHALSEVYKYRIGVSGVAFPSTTMPPPYTYEIQYPNGASIGVYGAGTLHNGDPGNPGPDWAGWFDGDVQVNGTGYITTTWISSDKRYKKNIKGLENVTEKLRKLNGYTYNFRTEEFAHKGFDNSEQVGLIAQEIQEIFPQLVKKDAKGYYSVNYDGLVPVLIEGFKAQQAQIDELKAMLTANAPRREGTATAVTLSDQKALVLDQNVPNPFAESTTVTYNIPDDFGKAQIIFSDVNGTVIKTVDITSKGEGTLNVFANDLTNGSYSYALIIDGQVIASKKMIKQ
jgi:hypothetical protein